MIQVCLSLVPDDGRIDLKLGTKHSVIKGFVKTLKGETSVGDPPYGMCYSAVSHEGNKFIRHTFL